MIVVLDLFSGSKSVSKAMRQNKNVKVITLDIKPKYEPDILEDILEWDYKKLKEIPDIIWASPPGGSYSFLNPYANRDRKTGKALGDNAKYFDSLLEKTIEIIKYFQLKNPKLKFIIENPKGLMRFMPILYKYKRYTVLYCNYGFNIQKPTDLFSNDTELKLDQYPICRDKKQTTPITQLESSFARSKVPPKLIKDIFRQFNSKIL